MNLHRLVWHPYPKRPDVRVLYWLATVGDEQEARIAATKDGQLDGELFARHLLARTICEIRGVEGIPEEGDSLAWPGRGAPIEDRMLIVSRLPQRWAIKLLGRVRDEDEDPTEEERDA